MTPACTPAIKRSTKEVIMDSDRNILSRWIPQWIRQPPPRNPIPYPVPKNLKWLCQERVLRGYPPCRSRRKYYNASDEPLQSKRKACDKKNGRSRLLISSAGNFSSIRDAARFFNLNDSTISSRLGRGWSVNQSLGLCPPPASRKRCGSL